MDLIYMNKDMEDVGVLLEYELDLAFGADENNFECTIAARNHCCEHGFFLYAEGTEYGGIVDGIKSDTASKEVVYSGRTWQGILNSKVLEPDAGADYLVCSGEANSVLASLLTRMGLSSLFAASSEDSGLTVSNYQMNRYIRGYDGMKKMLKTVEGKLKFTFDGGKVILSAVPVVDFTEDTEFDSDLIDFVVRKNGNPVNHLICLGSGDLAARTVIHLYADKDGNISQTQTQFGMDEVTDVYDYPNAESAEELQSSGIDKLKELWEPDDLSIELDDDSDIYDVGDIVGAYDNITGVYAKARITKKILTIKDGRITISYKVGDNNG